jgi:hypothetical protein
VADATPAGDYLTLHPHTRSRFDALRAWLADVWVSLRHGGRRGVLRGLAYLALAGLLGAGIVVVIREIRRRREGNEAKERGSRAALPRSLADLVAAIDRAFDAVGRPRPAAVGLLEHARALDDPWALETLEAAIDLVHRAAFAGETLDADAIARATRSVATIRSPAVR